MKKTDARKLSDRLKINHPGWFGRRIRIGLAPIHGYNTLYTYLKVGDIVTYINYNIGLRDRSWIILPYSEDLRFSDGEEKFIFSMEQWSEAAQWELRQPELDEFDRQRLERTVANLEYNYQEQLKWEAEVAEWEARHA